MKRTLPIVLVLTLLFGVAGISGAPRANAAADYDNHWAKDYIEIWSSVDNRIFDARGNFYPNEPMTRGDLARILFSVFDSPYVSSPSGYTDIPASSPLADAVASMREYEVLSGYPDGTFRPGNELTRNEMAVVMCRLIVCGDSRILPPTLVKDARSLPDWSLRQVLYLVGEGYISGYEDGAFRGQRLVTRAEALVMLARVLGMEEDSSDFMEEESAGFEEAPGQAIGEEPARNQSYIKEEPTGNQTYVPLLVVENAGVGPDGNFDGYYFKDIYNYEIHVRRNTGQVAFEQSVLTRLVIDAPGEAKTIVLEQGSFVGELVFRSGTQLIVKENAGVGTMIVDTLDPIDVYGMAVRDDVQFTMPGSSVVWRWWYPWEEADGGFSPIAASEPGSGLPPTTANGPEAAAQIPAEEEVAKETPAPAPAVDPWLQSTRDAYDQLAHSGIQRDFKYYTRFQPYFDDNRYNSTYIVSGRIYETTGRQFQFSQSYGRNGDKWFALSNDSVNQEKFYSLDDLARQYGPVVPNIVATFSVGSGPHAPYGHLVFIEALVDGYVYYTDTIDGIANTNAVHKRTVADFLDHYKQAMAATPIGFIKMNGTRNFDLPNPAASAVPAPSSAGGSVAGSSGGGSAAQPAPVDSARKKENERKAEELKKRNARILQASRNGSINLEDGYSSYTQVGKSGFGLLGMAFSTAATELTEILIGIAGAGSSKKYEEERSRKLYKAAAADVIYRAGKDAGYIRFADRMTQQTFDYLEERFELVNTGGDIAELSRQLDLVDRTMDRVSGYLYDGSVRIPDGVYKQGQRMLSELGHASSLAGPAFDMMQELTLKYALPQDAVETIVAAVEDRKFPDQHMLQAVKELRTDIAADVSKALQDVVIGVIGQSIANWVQSGRIAVPTLIVSLAGSLGQAGFGDADQLTKLYAVDMLHGMIGSYMDTVYYRMRQNPDDPAHYANYEEVFYLYKAAKLSAYDLAVDVNNGFFNPSLENKLKKERDKLNSVTFESALGI